MKTNLNNNCDLWTSVRAILTCVVIVSLTSCGGKKEATQEAMDHVSGTADVMEAVEPQFVVADSFKEQLAGVFTSYLKVKNAFVESDAAKVKEEATMTKQVLTAVDAKLLEGAALNDWSNFAGSIDKSLTEIARSTDIEVQRNAFSDLSETLYKSIKAYGLGTATAYYEYCPMAFDNQGAYWLSESKEIRNPYFGDKMLTCGRVEEILK